MKDLIEQLHDARKRERFFFRCFLFMVLIYALTMLMGCKGFTIPTT